MWVQDEWECWNQR